jgi:hypothetical protein
VVEGYKTTCGHKADITVVLIVEGRAENIARLELFRFLTEAVIHSLELTGLMSDFLTAAWTRDVPAMNKARAGCEKS